MPLTLVCSDYLFKLLLIGDSGVGKSCLLLRFAVFIRRPFSSFLGVFVDVDRLGSAGLERAIYLR